MLDPSVRKTPWRKAWHPSVLAWRIPWRDEPGRLQSMGSQSQTRLSNFTSLHFRYADDTTLRAESEEELKSLLMKVKEESERLA